MAINNEGKIFIGALDDLGYLDRQKNGTHIYVSLLKKIKPELRGMGNIWQTLVHDSLVYFEWETWPLLWNGERFQFFPGQIPTLPYDISFERLAYLYKEEGVGL